MGNHEQAENVAPICQNNAELTDTESPDLPIGCGNAPVSNTSAKFEKIHIPSYSEGPNFSKSTILKQKPAHIGPMYSIFMYVFQWLVSCNSETLKIDVYRYNGYYHVRGKK